MNSWTVKYALINITYFATFCTIHAFAAVYLLDRGFTNTQIGILLAVANVVSALAQPAVAAVIDKGGFFTNRNVIMISACSIAAGSALLLVFGGNRIVVFVIFALIYMIQFTYMPVMTALNFEYQRYGANIFYGLARGLGSAGFAVTSAIMGTVVEGSGVRSLLYVTIVVMLVHTCVVWLFRRPDKAVLAEGPAADGGKAGFDEAGKDSTIWEFVRKYPAFMLMLLATVFLFYTHNMLNDYLIQIIRQVGGSESDLGYATFIAALLELPTMAVITIISKKVSMNLLLIISGVSFTIKAAIMMLATSIPLVYASQAMQLLAYAVFIPASAYYVSNNIAEHDQVKGQAFVTSCFTLSGVFSSLICGVILDRFGVKHMLVAGTIVSVIGMLLIMKAMRLSAGQAGPTEE